MKCLTCLKKLKEGDRIIEVGRFVSSRHGDFVTNVQNEYVHYKCIAQAYNG